MIFALHSLGNTSTIPALAVGVSTSTAAAASIGNGPYTTNAVVVTASGGVSPYTYAWTKVSGGTVTISSATATSVTWSASGTAPETKAAVWKCSVTDAIGTVTDSGAVSVSIAFNVSTLSASLSTGTLSATLSGSGSLATGTVTATPTGGTGPYTYAWSKVSGDTVTPSSTTTAAITFSATGTAPQTIAAVWQCVVTDSTTSTASAGTVSISLVYSAPALSASLSASSTYGALTGSGTVVTSPTITCNVTGGVSPYTYLWTYNSGDAGLYPEHSTLAATAFLRYGSPTNHYTAYWKCVATDSIGSTATSGLVTVECDFDSNQ